MSTVVITAAGVDITDLVEYRTAKFMSTVNGVAGTAVLRVKDAAHDLSFPTGKKVTVDIDGVRSWGGYIMQAKRVYPLPVTDLGLNDVFYWELTCSDYNILLVKRVVYDHDNPEKVYVTAPDAHKCSDQRPYDWAPGTHDDVIIDYVISNYTDLEADGVDISGIDFVGAPSPDLCGAYSTASTIADFLNAADFRFLGSIYYINPAFEFHYVDDETPTAPHPLTDTPTDDFVRYREFEIFRNGADLINEAYVWGTGLGANHWVVGHQKDSDSIAAHHLWQWADVTTTLIHQASVDLRADTAVNGSPSHHRGHKDDAISVTCSIFEPGYTAGQVVRFISNIYDYDDTLPIRRCTITFPTPTDPRWDLQLGFDPDQPWENFETLPPPKINLPSIGPIITIDNQATTDCFDVDNFNRADGPLGIASSGISWFHVINSAVLDNTGQVYTDYLGDGINPGFALINFGLGPGENFELSMRMYMHDNSDVSESDPITDLDGLIDWGWGVGWLGMRILGNGDGTNTSDIIIRDVDGNSDSFTLASDFWETINPGGWAIAKFTYDDGTAKAKIWHDGDTEPDWQVSIEATFEDFTGGGLGSTGSVQNDTTNVPLTYSSLIMDWINQCSPGGSPFNIIDTFTRSVSGGWGVTDSGQTWINNSDTSTVDVNGTQATISDSNTDVAAAMTLSIPGSTSIDATIKVVDIDDENKLLLMLDSSDPFATQVAASINVTGKSGSTISGTLVARTSSGSNSTSFSVVLPAWFRIVGDTSGVRTMIWHVGSSPPSSWPVAANGNDTPFPVLAVGWNNSADPIDITLDDLNALRTIAVTTSYQGSGDSTCETPVGVGIGPYKLSNSYLTRTLLCYDDGYLINPATVQEVDQVQGTFLLGAEPSGKLVVCYTLLDLLPAGAGGFPGGSSSPGGSGGGGGGTGGGSSGGGSSSGSGGGGSGTSGGGGGGTTNGGGGNAGDTYGSMFLDTKANHRVGPDGVLALKFKASQASPINAVRFSQRGGPTHGTTQNGYSSQNGLGGTMRISIQGDAGGKPSGSELAGLDFSPSNPTGDWTTYDDVTFGSPYTPAVDEILYVVFQNSDNTRYISVNMVYVYGAVLIPRQTFKPDSDYAVLASADGGNTWSIQGRYTAPLDVEYDNGKHDGQAYIGNIVSNYGTISGSSNMVRENFTVTGASVTVSGVGVRVRRISGSGDLTATLETGAHSLIEAIVIPGASSIPTSQAGGDTGGSVRLEVDFLTNHVLTLGDEFNLILSCPSGTTYTVACILQGDSVGFASFAFRDGSGQKTTNGGSSWSDLYAFDDVDFEFYFKVVA